MSSGFSTSFLGRLVQIQTAALVLVFAGILVSGYHGQTWSEVQSFQVVDNWCEVGSQGIGNHCFGDFGLPYFRGLGANPYTENNFAAANTPLTAVIFEVLRLFPYNFALLVYLISMIAALSVPFFSRKSRLSGGERIQLAVLSSLITCGGIVAFDRGNHVAFFVPLLVGFLLSVQREKWRQAVILMTLMAMLKFWGILFVVVLIARSKWLHAVTSIFLAGILSAVLLIPFPGSFASSVKAMISMAGNRDYANAVSGYSISLHGFLRRTSCAVSSPNWCDTKAHGDSIWASPVVSIAIAIGLSLAVYFLVRNPKVPDLIWITSAVSLGFLAVPEAPMYNLVLLAAIPAVIACLPEYSADPNWRLSTGAVMAALVVSQTPFTLFSTTASRFASGTSDSVVVFRSAYWITPSLWVTFLLLVLIDYLRGGTLYDKQNRDSKRNGKLPRNRDVKVEEFG
jgi:hypothetical protein